MFELTESETGETFRLSGRLEISEVHRLSRLLEDLASRGILVDRSWDLSEVERIDMAAALLLWDAWGCALPQDMVLAQRHREIFDRLAQMDPDALDYRGKPHRGGDGGASLLGTISGVLTVLGRFVLDLLYVLRHPGALPWKETSAACYRIGATALPIVCIVGLLIGIVLSYLSSLQLRAYGAESFLPLILGVGVVRELGPLLAAVVIAGRSGSSITAGLAAMRLTQELDALSALGVSHSLRLVFPRTLALALTLPLLVVCTNAAALLGGLVAGWVELDFDPWAFMQRLAQDVSIVHLNIGLLKSLVFGFTIGLIACYFGLAARANTQSLSQETTRSVVLSISSIIVLDALFAIVFKDIPA